MSALIAVVDALPLTAALPLAVVLGLCLGSFTATLVLRWGAGRSIGGRSVCDGCGRKLRWFELVPLLGWTMQRGRCTQCGAVIDSLHLRVELAAAGVGLLSLLLLPGVGGWLLALMGWMLLPLALLDARHFWLPDELVGSLALVGLLLAGPMLGTALTDRLIGAMSAGLALALIAALFARLRGREAMGGGDPKLAAAIGAWLGWAALPFMLLIASAAGIVWAVLGDKGNVSVRDRHIPFGSFMAAAAWCTVPLWPLISGQ